MRRSRKHYVWGLAGDREVGPQMKTSLTAAARTFYKMADQGLTNLRVTDWLGRAIPKSDIERAYRADSERAMAKFRRIQGL